ncbi:MAG: leucine-rich repeat domain-containing protein [Saprospiraceae bacterium]|nr:leucine-rich repeat domain-containing protein [Saprospiraceae bacterium]
MGTKKGGGQTKSFIRGSHSGGRRLYGKGGNLCGSLTILLVVTFTKLLKFSKRLIILDSSITAIDLSNQNLKSVPSVVFKSTQVKVLLLERNRLIALPAEIGELKNLILLDLRGNNLTTLPNEISGLKALWFLNLHSNYLTVLPPDIRQMISLAYMDLGNTRISWDYIKQLKEDMPWCKIGF